MRGLMRGWLMAAALAFLAACAPAPTLDGGGNAPGATPSSVPPHEMNADQCGVAGGTMRPVCMMGTVQCVVPYSDAGQTCRDGDDCQGDCRSDEMSATGPVTGRCQANSDPCGCFANVEDGRIDGALCVD